MKIKMLTALAIGFGVLALAYSQLPSAQEAGSSAKGYILIEHAAPTREILDALKPYSAATGPLLDQYGGRFIVSSVRNMESLEGGWTPPFFAVLEFPSYAQARAFYYSEEYQAVLPIRLEEFKGSKAILIEGRP